MTARGASWTFASARMLIAQTGGASRLAQHLEAAGFGHARRPLLVTDAGVAAAGLTHGALCSLRAQGMDVSVYAGTTPDPAESLVLAAAEQAMAHAADVIIGFGGGSSMDIAKLVAVLAEPTAAQPLAEMYGVDNVRGTRLPLVQVPTTAGTGSEVTPISIITLGADQKAGVVSSGLLPDIALLDGELTRYLPGHVAAATGVDAMVHAIEAYTSRLRKNPLSDLLAAQALGLLSTNLAAVSREGGDDEARGAMLLGSCYAGMAFANAPVAAVHALAYPLGAQFHVPHGLSNSLMLPHVLAYNAEDEDAAQLYAEIASHVLGTEATRGAPRQAARALVEHFTALPGELGLPSRLSEVGVAESDILRLAEDAMKQTRLLPNNPREVGLRDAIGLYEAAM